jgi:predicted RNA-binding protein with RPS1 domain
MKNTFRKAFMAACSFPALLLTAASSEQSTIGPLSLFKQCLRAAAYRSAQPAGLDIHKASSNMLMGADIASKTSLLFSLQHTEQIQSSIEKLANEHQNITQHFILTDTDCEIVTPNLRPIEKSRSEEIAESLPDILDNLYENRLTISDCRFLLNNQEPADYSPHLNRLDKLQTKVETHFSQLCEGNIIPDAISVFEDQKATLSKTVNDAISLTRKRMDDLRIYAECIQDMCKDYNIEQKLEVLLDAQETEDAIRMAIEEKEREEQRQREEDEQRSEEHAEEMRQIAKRMAEIQRQTDEYVQQKNEESENILRRIAESQTKSTKNYLLRVALPTAILSVAASAYMFKTGYKEGLTWIRGLAMFGPLSYCGLGTLFHIPSLALSLYSSPLIAMTLISTLSPTLTESYRLKSFSQ